MNNYSLKLPPGYVIDFSKLGILTKRKSFQVNSYKDSKDLLKAYPDAISFNFESFDHITAQFPNGHVKMFNIDNSTGYWIEYEQEDKPSTAVKGRSTLECPHIWQKYEGFTESYTYCQLCDIKERPVE